jgi:hypothetical protein
MTQVDTKMMQLLNQYAQEFGFEDLADLKANYTEKGYEHTLPQMIVRARREMGEVNND